MIRNGLLFQRNETIDGEGRPVPAVPAGWRVHFAHNGWYTLRRLSDGLQLAAFRANAHPSAGKGLYLLLGPRAELDAMSGGVSMRAAWADRGTPSTRVWLRRWPIWRCQGVERVVDIGGGSSLVAFDGVRRLLRTEGLQIPDPATDPFPWLFDEAGNVVQAQAQARIRVDSITRPALDSTVAGFQDHVDAEDTDAPG